MRRRLNLRILVVLIILVPVAAGGIHLLHNYQVRRNAGALLEQADRAEEKGDRAGAVDYLQRYVSLNRGDAPAWARLGLLLDRQATNPRARLKAFFVIEQALRLDSEQHQARRRLVRVALDLGRHGDAHDHLNKLLKSFPNDAELEDLQGECAVAAAHFADADQWWQKAVGHAPDRVECWVRRAYLLRRRLNRADDADRVLEEMIAANPQSAAAFLARGQYRAEFQDREQAARDIEQALKLAPDDAEVLLAAADLAQSRARADAARAHLDRGIQKHPRDGRFLLGLARLDLRAGRLKEAAEHLGRSLPLLTDPITRWMAVDLLLDAGKADQARAALSSLENAGLSGARIDYLQARLQMAGQNWGRARVLLEGARQGLDGSPALLKRAHLLLASCYQRLGNPDLRVAACRAALAVDPAWVPARLELASATAATGRLDEALTLYEKLAPDVPATRLATGRLLLRKTLRQPAAQRNWAEVERFFQETPEELRKGIEGRLLWTNVQMAQGRLADAETFLEAAHTEQPRALEYRIALSALADRRKRPDQAQALLDAAERELGDQVDLRLARAARALLGPKEEIHERLTGLTRDVERFEKPEQARLLDGLVLAALRADDVSLARGLADRRVRLRPNDVNGRLLAFRLALQTKDATAARQLLDDLRQTEGEEGALWRYGQAALWLRFAKTDDRSGLATARKHLNEAAKVRTSWAPLALLDAQLCEREGNFDQAIERYRQAVTLGERQPGVVRRVVQLLHERRRYGEAEEVLRHLQEETPLTGALGRLAAEVSLLGHRDPEQTLDLARKAVGDVNADYRDQLWLGQMLAALDRRDDAEKVFRRALELKGDVPDTWVALVLFLARGQQTDAAEKVLREAQGKLGTAAALPLAVCWETLGRRDQAGEGYAAALKAKPDDPEVLQAVASFHLRVGHPREAEPLLRKLLATKAAPGVTAWARRSLALGLALAGSPARGKEALALVEENLKQPGAGLADQRARALVLALQPGHRRESIRLLEESFARMPASPDEQFLLARLYEADHNWPKARARLLDLLTAGETKNPLHLAYFVAALIRHDDAEAAEHWLKQLEKQEPDSWATLEVRARLLARQGRGTDAARLLEEYANGSTDADVTLAAARLLDTLEQSQVAEKLYRRYGRVSARPEAALVLAEFLGHHGRCDEALALAERAGAKCKPEVFAAFCAGFVGAPGIKPEQQQRVERWLTAASAKHPKSIPALLALAQLRDVQGRYADAQGLYRKVLALEPANVIAANNLAVLLALRNQLTEAVALSRQAIDRAGPLAALLDTRGTALLMAGQVEQAVNDLEEAVAQQPTALRYYHLARAYHAAKNRNAALVAYRKGKKLGLHAGVLHPLERGEYKKVQAELGDEPGRRP